jgi:peroxiredoxin
VFATDAGGAVGRTYGAFDVKNNVDNRSLFVVAPDGHVAYVTKPFKVLAPSSYSDLAHVIDKLEPAADSSASGK